MGSIKIIGSIALLLSFSNALAGEITSTVFEKADNSSGFSGSVEVSASGGMIEDSIAGGFSLLFEGGYSGLSFAAAAPLRFTDEKTPEGKRTLIRSADWDEASDFSRIIPYVSYGGNDTAYHLYAGLLSGVSMGHSSIVDGYYGAVDTDHYQAGVYLRYFGAAFGGEALLDNYLDPSWTAVRGYLRPLAFMNPPDILKRITVGFTAAADFLAPVKVKKDGNGAIILDRYYLPENETDEISVTGFDADWMIVADKVFDFSLYFDYNLIAGVGEGLHTGFMINAEGDQT
ncbi:MAG: hypothetical protein FJ088_10785, partial [Deltaproteobacteria bacterium]|nr:hypothetical protein [Deltaproteobacteria bacterium]